MGIDIWEVIEAASTKPFASIRLSGTGLGATVFRTTPSISPGRPRSGTSTRVSSNLPRNHTNMPYHVLESVGRALNQHKKALNGSKVLVLESHIKRTSMICANPRSHHHRASSERGSEGQLQRPYFPEVGRGRNTTCREVRTAE